MKVKFCEMKAQASKPMGETEHTHTFRERKM